MNLKLLNAVDCTLWSPALPLLNSFYVNNLKIKKKTKNKILSQT